MMTSFSTDIEEGRQDTEFDERMVRHRFVRRVYFILTLQLLATCGIIGSLISVEEFQDFLIENPSLIIFAFIAVLVLSIMLSCCSDFRRKAPMNYVCLGLFTIAESVLLGFICIRIEPMTVITALGITAAVCFALTIFAMQTKWDFTVISGFLVVCLVVGLILGIILIFFHNRTVYLIYLSLGIVLFSLYLIVDTQAMMGGNYQYSIAPDEYVFGALNLYVDICQIFLCILRLLASEE